MGETGQADYQKALKLAEDGCYQQALDYIEQHLHKSPDDVQALNDAGAILHCMGRSQEAAEYLSRAKQLSGGCAETVWNLMEVYAAEGMAEKVVELFDGAEQLGILNPDILNRTAKIFLDKGDKAGAIEVMLRSLRLWPEQEILEHMINVIKSKRPRVGFFCGEDGMTFLGSVFDFVSRRFNTCIFDGTTKEELHELMKECDIAWFEWCTNLAAIGSRFEKCCKVIVRLHRYEAYTNWPRQINWDNVDVLITVGNSFVKEALFEVAPQVEQVCSIVDIPNGVNLDSIKFIERERGKHIAFLGNLRMVKNPAFMLQCMHKLRSMDAGYKLFLGGMFQDRALEQYARHMIDQLGLGDTVFFDGWQSDINAWLEDKHYVVSSSIIESQGMGILECMAAGLKPVIHNFPGAEEIYPKEFLFDTPEEFCEKILSQEYEPRRYREFVEQKYSLAEQLKKINNLLIGFEKELDGRSGSDGAS